jgi:Resolvase, N terminal domain
MRQKACFSRIDFEFRRRCERKIWNLLSQSGRELGARAMAAYGYARVSTTDQDVTIQEAALRAVGCEVIRSETRSGTATAGRTELQTLIDFARKGDTLVVTRIDRLARSIADLAAIVRALKAWQSETPDRRHPCTYLGVLGSEAVLRLLRTANPTSLSEAQLSHRPLSQ